MKQHRAKVVLSPCNVSVKVIEIYRRRRYRNSEFRITNSALRITNYEFNYGSGLNLSLEDLNAADNGQGLHLFLGCVNDAEDHEDKASQTAYAG